MIAWGSIEILICDGSTAYCIEFVNVASPCLVQFRIPAVYRISEEWNIMITFFCLLTAVSDLGCSQDYR